MLATWRQQPVLPPRAQRQSHGRLSKYGGYNECKAKVASDCVHDNDRASGGTTGPAEMAIWSVFRLEEMIEDLEKKYDEAWARQ